MQIPLHSIIRPLVRNWYASRYCWYRILNLGPYYCAFLGLLGTVLTFLDLCRVVRGGDVLPHSLKRARLISGWIATQQRERDLKLIFCTVTLEVYALLFMAGISNNPVLYMPYIFGQAMIIALDTLTIFILLFELRFQLILLTLASHLFTVYNLSVVFCCFRHSLSVCDY